MPDIEPRRSVLYVPADKPRAIAKARALPVDAVILDLEDSVSPERKRSGDKILTPRPGMPTRCSSASAVDIARRSISICRATRARFSARRGSVSDALSALPLLCLFRTS